MGLIRGMTGVDDSDGVKSDGGGVWVKEITKYWRPTPSKMGNLAGDCIVASTMNHPKDSGRKMDPTSPIPLTFFEYL